MQSKTEKPEIQENTTESVEQKTSSYSNSNPTYWNMLNLLLTISATNAMILLVQQPFRTWVLNVMSQSKEIPSFNKSFSTATILNVARHYYRGMIPAIPGSYLRTGYIKATEYNKNAETKLVEGMVKEEIITDEKSVPKKKINHSFLFTAALGELLITQGFNNYSQLQKANIVPPQFNWKKWHILRSLTFNGWSAAYTSSFIGITSMLVAEERIANALPISNPIIQHMVSGAVSGALAASFSYLPGTFKDYQLLRTKLTANGKLVNEPMGTTFQSLVAQYKGNPEFAIQTFKQQTKKLLPAKMLFSGSLFMIISSVQAALGAEPLAKFIEKPQMFDDRNSKPMSQAVMAEQDAKRAEKAHATSPKIGAFIGKHVQSFFAQKPSQNAQKHVENHAHIFSPFENP